MKELAFEVVVMLLLWVLWVSAALADPGAVQPVRTFDFVREYEQVPQGMCMYVMNYPDRPLKVEYQQPKLMCK